MFYFSPTLILRHRKENLKKCSLRGLEHRGDICFFAYPKENLPSLENYLLLTLDAPVLTKEDAHLGLLLLDGTWRYAQTMLNHIPAKENIVKRSLPANIRTAYPRKQTDCPDPTVGLASVEALYAAYQILGRDTEGLLDHYHWGEKFLGINSICMI